MSKTLKITIREYDDMIARGAFVGWSSNRVELIYGKLQDRIEGGPLKLTIREYEQMIANGGFDGLSRRIELIRGELRQFSSDDPLHDHVLSWLNRWSTRSTSNEVLIYARSGVTLTKVVSIPEPDLYWVRPGDYTVQRPQAADVLLVIEVACSSLPDDLGEKKDLYAQGGVREYWVVDVGHQAIHVFRNPQDGEFQEQFIVGPQQTISPLAVPEAVLELQKLFA